MGESSPVKGGSQGEARLGYFGAGAWDGEGVGALRLNMFHTEKCDPSIWSRFLCVTTRLHPRVFETRFLHLLPRIIVYQSFVNSIPRLKRILNYSSVQTPPFCDHTFSSTSFRDAIPPSPSEDYRVPVQSKVNSIPRPRRIQNYSSVQTPPFCDHTFSSTSCRDAIPPSFSEDYRVPVPVQLYFVETGFLHLFPRIILYQSRVNSIARLRRVQNYSSVQTPPFCDHTFSSTSCRDAIPPSFSEDYRVPVPGQLYCETEENTKLFLSTNPSFCDHTFSSTSFRDAIPPSFSEDYRVAVPGQLYSEIESQISGDIISPPLFALSNPIVSQGSKNLLDRPFWRVSFPLRRTRSLRKAHRIESAIMDSFNLDKCH
ncbi:unnamed protein product [Cyprideis torosa]|uniref:Uncharacterized protein n=1 Tax=Cyprideis torosa TaxID=163714 RepID=A0A7R8WJ47_9CRUS|nr:unnamed protein product [Cyprideis torosa]CAG0894817.1 unnamed protein product [Cyprideis torosa]